MFKIWLGFLGGASGEESTCWCRRSRTPERAPRVGNGNPLQYSSYGKFYGQGTLAGYSPWGCKRVRCDWVTSHTHTHTHAHTQGMARGGFWIGAQSSSGWLDNEMRQREGWPWKPVLLRKPATEMQECIMRQVENEIQGEEKEELGRFCKK